MQTSKSGSAAMPPSRAAILPTVGGKYFALAVLFSMNLLNYVDRYSFFAVGTHIKRNLKIDDFWYRCAGCGVHDRLHDRFAGDGLDGRSLITASSCSPEVCFSGAWRPSERHFRATSAHMFFWRALLGVGEASYGVIAPALIVGPVSGEVSVAGRWASTTWPCRWAGHWDICWEAGSRISGMAGGILGGGSAGCIRGGGRAGDERPRSRRVEGRVRPPRRSADRLNDYFELFRTPTFLYNTAGMAAVTFATGAYAAWGSTFIRQCTACR